MEHKRTTVGVSVIKPNKPGSMIHLERMKDVKMIATDRSKMDGELVD
jgi:hypothetical protein